MSIMKLNVPAETVTQPVFVLYGIPYLPHYVDKHRWVGPGRKHERTEFKTADLLANGARLITMDLWERSWTKEVKGWKTL